MHTRRHNSCRDISLEDTRILQADKEPFMQFWGFYYEHAYHKERGDITAEAEARLRLEDMKGAISKSIWKALKLDER